MNILCLFDSTVDRGECELLKGLKANGLEPYVLCKPKSLNIEAVEELRTVGIPVEIIEAQSKLDLTYIKRLREITKEYKFDLIHAFRKRALSNLIFSHLDQRLPPVVAYRGIIGNLSYWDPFSWLTFLNPSLSRIVCVCDAVRNYFLQKRFFIFFSLIKKERVVRIYKGHRIEWYQFPNKDKSILGQFGIPRHAKVIGCVSRVQARKGIKELILSMHYLKSISDVHLLILGQINDNSWRKAYERSPSKDRIHIVGHQPNAAEIAGLFDIFTLPSLRREGLPRSVIEAMSQGIVPVVSDAGGNPELIVNGVSGIIVPAGDINAMASAFNELLENDELRKKMGAAAKARIQHAFNSNQTIEQTISLYEQVLLETK